MHCRSQRMNPGSPCSPSQWEPRLHSGVYSLLLDPALVFCSGELILVLFCFEAGFQVAQASLKPLILLPVPPRCYDCKAGLPETLAQLLRTLDTETNKSLQIALAPTFYLADFTTVGTSPQTSHICTPWSCVYII